MSEANEEPTNRAVDDEGGVVEHGSDPGASYPAGDESPPADDPAPEEA